MRHRVPVRRCLMTISSAVLLISGAMAAVPGRIVFEREGAIYTVEADGTSETKLSVTGVPATLSHPAWLPDGRQIAFGALSWGEEAPAPGEKPSQRDTYQVCHIWTLRIGDSAAVRIAEVAPLPREPKYEIREIEWSADGTRIGFEVGTVLEETGNPDIRYYVVNRNGKGVMSSGSAAYDDSLQPRRRLHEERSPDGKRLLQSRTLGDVDELFISDTDGSNACQLTHTASLRDTAVTNIWGGGVISGVWSPDGARVVFIPLMEGADYAWGGLFSVHADGSGQTRLGKDMYLVGDLPKAWSPDGKRLAYEDDGAIYVADFMSSPRKIATGHTPDWGP